MRTTLLLFVGLTLGSLGAHAEDFTGFYAGVNAGYAFARDKDRQTGPVTVPDSAAADRGLPPSAESASQAMQAATRSRSGRPPR